MEEQEIYAQVNDVFATVFKRNNITVSADTTAADIDGWDSLTHMLLIDSVEKHFGIKFKLMEVMKFNNVGDMIVTIHKKLASK